MLVTKISSNSLSMSSKGMVSYPQQAGFLSLPNDNIVKVLGVAVLLCLVCSIVVSGAATLLKPTQVANALLDKKRNILAVSGIQGEGKSIEELFTQIEARVVDLSSGEYTDAVDANTFDQRKASKEAEYRIDLDKQDDIAQIGGYSKYANVYLVRDGDAVSKIILPIKGYGLWSTLYGFIALQPDANTVSGITFYEHKETPGLGGEIENKAWQASWDGKLVAKNVGTPELRVIKGTVTTATPNAEYKVDGLAGATLTSNGVSNIVQFWLGENAFGPYLERTQQQYSNAASAVNNQKSTQALALNSAEQG